MVCWCLGCDAVLLIGGGMFGKSTVNSTNVHCCSGEQWTCMNDLFRVMQDTLCVRDCPILHSIIFIM